MGKFLRLVVEKWDKGVSLENDDKEIEAGYIQFFNMDRRYFESSHAEELKQYVDTSLQDEQIRPLALLLMYDGLLTENTDLLQKAKTLFEYSSAKTGNFSFEDAGHLATIANKLK